MGWEDDADRVLASVCDAALDDLPSVVDRTLDAVVRAVPSYAEARTPGDLDDFRSGLQLGIRLSLECVVDERSIDEEERRALSLLGAQRARQGIPAEDLVLVLHLARDEVLDILLAQARHVESSAATALEAARRLATRLARFTAAVEPPLLAGHAQGLEEWFPVGSRRRAVVVDRLLEGRWTSEEAVAEDMRAVGRVLGPRMGLLLVVAGDKFDHEGLVRAAGALADRIEDAVAGAVRWSPVPHVPVVLSTASDADWASRLRHADEVARAQGVAVVAGQPVSSAGELTAAYRGMSPLLKRAVAARRGPGIIPLSRLELLQVLAGDAGLADRMALVRGALGPILALPDADAMLEILDAFHETSGRVADVAQAVHRHENTVRKRLDRIEALTGLSMQVPAERYRLETAVHLHRILLHELGRLDHREFQAGSHHP